MWIVKILAIRVRFESRRFQILITFKLKWSTELAKVLVVWIFCTIGMTGVAGKTILQILGNPLTESFIQPNKLFIYEDGLFLLLVAWLFSIVKLSFSTLWLSRYPFFLLQELSHSMIVKEAISTVLTFTLIELRWFLAHWIVLNHADLSFSFLFRV